MTDSSSPSETTIELKPIKELLECSFFVPQYQRGYRWTRQQVEDLLNDLWEFAQKTELRDTFYCLQPVIVKRSGSKWELIDGQQRLTTVYILLRYLNDNFLKGGASPFSLEFATRPNSQAFLENIESDKKSENIDFYHISAAYDCIRGWFDQKEIPQLTAIQLYPVLLDRTRVIWYEPAEATSEHAIFIRINSGKIPLTNAELIKALFLKRAAGEPNANSEQFRRRQIEVATEWDTIEAELQRDELWYFLNKDANQQATRIEFVFNSITGVKPSSQDEYATFRAFNTIIATASLQEVLAAWLSVKNRFLLFKEWFDNREWYHLIGYLIAVGVPIEELVQQAENSSKSAFRVYLTDRIRRKVSYQLEALDYNSHKETLKDILLLFNVETLRRNQAASYRFPFHQYKGNGGKSLTWSLEHVHPQKAKALGSSERNREWLRDAQRFITEMVESPGPALEKKTSREKQSTPKQLLTEITVLLTKKELDKAEFETMQERIFGLFGEPELHTIDNLALLSKNDNSALSNGIFPQKRARIMELEKEGSFIPIATRNVFLKYYSTEPAHMGYWTAADRKSYLQAIKETLVEYLPQPAHS